MKKGMGGFTSGEFALLTAEGVSKINRSNPPRRVLGNPFE